MTAHKHYKLMQRYAEDASELLASLRELVAYCEELGFDLLCMAQAKAAITKATTISDV